MFGKHSLKRIEVNNDKQQKPNARRSPAPDSTWDTITKAGAAVKHRNRQGPARQSIKKSIAEENLRDRPQNRTELVNTVKATDCCWCCGHKPPRRVICHKSVGQNTKEPRRQYKHACRQRPGKRPASLSRPVDRTHQGHHRQQQTAKQQAPEMSANCPSSGYIKIFRYSTIWHHHTFGHTPPRIGRLTDISFGQGFLVSGFSDNVAASEAFSERRPLPVAM